MTYGKDFFVISGDGCRIESDGVLRDKKYFPQLHPFRYADGTGGWWLVRDFTVEILIGRVWYRVTAKAGFDYDGASIPRGCRTLVGDKMGHDVIVAAMFHDLFYCVHHAVFGKAASDSFFRAVAGVYSATLAKRIAIYQAVNLFGGGPWREDAPAKVAKYAEMLIVEEVA